MKKQLFTFLAILVLAAGAFLLQQQPTHAQVDTTSAAVLLTDGFSYQGILTQDGLSVTGVYDFRISIHNFIVAGDQLATDTITNVDVDDGLFTLAISADSSVFTTGGTRWIQIEVRPAGTETWEMLPSRQRIEPVPQATYAEYTRNLISTGETIVKVSPFNALELDGGNALTFAANGDGLLEVTANNGTYNFLIPADVPSQIFGNDHELRLMEMRFCYSGFQQDGVTNRATIRSINVFQVTGTTKMQMLGENFTPALSATNDCETVTGFSPDILTGSLYMNVGVELNNLVPLEIGEISLVFSSDN